MSLTALLSTLSFTSPWILTALLGLPLLWWLLRVLPPAPKTVSFPALSLLIGLQTEQKSPDSAPWWLVLLRLLAAAIVILALAHPVIDPQKSGTGDGALVLVVDNDWSSAGGWSERRDAMLALLDEAERVGRSVRLLITTPPTDGTDLQDPGILRAEQVIALIRDLDPVPWQNDWSVSASIVEGWADGAASEPVSQVYWAWNGREGLGFDELGSALGALAPLTMMVPDTASSAVVIDPPEAGTRDLTFTLRRGRDDIGETFALIARAEDGRALDRVELTLVPGEDSATATYDLPTELRNTLVSVELEQGRGAGATALIDERWQRRPVGMIAQSSLDSGPSLLSEAYFVRRALEPIGELSQGPVDLLLRTGQATIVAPDSASLTDQDRNALQDWIGQGGVLIRFAGPKLAADREDTLIPVALRGGGRILDGAMVWSEPLTLGQFSNSGPFGDLRLPDDVTITRQVLAQPTPDLDAKTWARLSDGTPLITAEQRGEGWLVLVHTTANADWSSLALSGTFVEILERLIGLSRGVANTESEAILLPPLRLLDGFGRLTNEDASATPIPASEIAATLPGPLSPPGFYGSDLFVRAVNIGPTEPEIGPPDAMPEGAIISGYAIGQEIDLKPALLIATFVLLILDGLITLYLRDYFDLRQGTIRNDARAAAIMLVVGAMALATGVGDAKAQSNDDRIIAALGGTVLAYVVTDDRQVDETSRAGLAALSQVLLQRTAVEAADPIGVDVQRDELSFYPLLYWPVTENQNPPSARTIRRLNDYMASGGTILFDTRDQAMAGLGGRAGRNLQRIAAGLDIPPLSRINPEHVLTKSFYLMQEFPGRWNGGGLWVETAGVAANDSVSRVIVGGNDWAGAWATDDIGQPLYPTVPGGNRQRELAYRFGVNLVMYTLTGNYKADQVHIPAILERLGQ